MPPFLFACHPVVIGLSILEEEEAAEERETPSKSPLGTSGQSAENGGWRNLVFPYLSMKICHREFRNLTRYTTSTTSILVYYTLGNRTIEIATVHVLRTYILYRVQ